MLDSSFRIRLWLLVKLSMKEEIGMEKEDLIEIAEGLRMIEEGVMKIQGIMRTKKMKSIQEVAAELIPFFKADDDALTDSVIKKLESKR